MAIMIPFLSTKSFDDPRVTGEMGSGFFYVYRYPWCQYVIFQTVYQNQLTVIQATPILKDQRVIDIDYQMTQQTVNRPNGTTVEIVL